MLNADLVKKFLVCPACKSSLREVDGHLLCLNAACRRRYAIREGIPIMMLDASETLDPSDYERSTRS